MVKRILLVAIVVSFAGIGYERFTGHGIGVSSTFEKVALGASGLFAGGYGLAASSVAGTVGSAVKGVAGAFVGN